MITYFCPHCWAEIPAKSVACPHCGADLAGFEAETFEDKLLEALHHSLPERRIMAAQILGNIQSRRAVPLFEQILQSEEKDFFFLRAVLLSLAKINPPQCRLWLERAAQHPSILVSRFAQELLARLDRGQPLDEWERHPG